MYPKWILDTAVSFFRHVHDKYGTEAGLVVRLDNGLYSLHCPKQRISAALTEFLEPIEGIAMHIHSHHTMSAFISVADCVTSSPMYLKVVIGRIREKEVQVICKRKTSEFEDLRFVPGWQDYGNPFGTSVPENVSFPLEWLDNLEVKKQNW